MNKKYKKYIVIIISIIIVLLIACIVIINIMKDTKKNGSINANGVNENMNNRIEIPDNAIIENGTLKLDENTYIELEESFYEETSDIEEISEDCSDYQFATYFASNYLKYLAQGDEQALLALNPAGKSSIKVKNGSNIEIKHVLSGGYLYNKTYYVQVIIDSETYYLVELFDVNNKTFQVSEIDKDEYGNAINNRMKEAYNRPYIIEKNQFNGCENFVLK